jgi:uracil phosphoribosyltransferase
MKNLIIIDHPLIRRDLTLLRNKKTTSCEFRTVLFRAANLLAYEVTRSLPTKKVTIETPLEKTGGVVLGRSVVLMPILRAGLGLVGGFVEAIPDACIGHIGLFRDEQTLRPIDYYFKAPRNLNSSLVLILDPMLATGGSGAAAISYLKNRGAREIVFVCLVAAPEGVRKIHAEHPRVKIYTCAVDRKLNAHGYILPGLGDAGDRLFGTE